MVKVWGMENDYYIMTSTDMYRGGIPQPYVFHKSAIRKDRGWKKC